MFDLLLQGFGSVLDFIYNTLAFQNYGLAIIIFTILIKALILPLTVKQYNNTVKQNELQPQVMKIHEKYKGDRKKQSFAVVEFYKENKVNPASGCLPLLIQMPVLIMMFMVISHPLRYMAHKSAEVVSQLFAMLPAEAISRYRDISIINYFTANPDQMSSVSDLLSPADLFNLNFLSINLGDVPSFNFLFTGDFSAQVSISTLLLLVVPLLVFVTAYISANYAEKFSKNRKIYQQRKKLAPTTGLTGALQNMNNFTPIMSTLICFGVPAGLGIYWICSNSFMILQQMYMHNFVYDKQPANPTDPAATDKSNNGNPKKDKKTPPKNNDRPVYNATKKKKKRKK